MNHKMIIHTIGQVLLVEAALLLLPVFVSLLYAEWWGAGSLLISAAISLVCGAVLTLLTKKRKHSIYAKEGLIIVSLAWIAVSLVGALPFVISGAIPSYINALFETVSGFTTTGATILLGNQIESMGHGLLFWRSFTHWIGGMGVLVFVMAIISRTPDRTMNILRAEMPGPIVDKLVPRAKDTAKILYFIYIGLTLLLIILLLAGGMPLFDSVVYAMGTAGTGGFGIKADSLASYNHYLQWVITMFMLLFGVNFNIYYLILIRKFNQAFKSHEFWTYVCIFLVAATLVTVSIYPIYKNVGEAIRLSCFQVSSLLTTTGYSVADFTAWDAQLAKTLLIICMFIGGCAGSTAGGFKVSRLVILFKKVCNDLKKVLHPRATSVVKFEGKVVDDTVLSSLATYAAVYIMSFITILILLSLEANFSFEANFTAAASCFNNIGPIYDVASGTFTDYSALSKIVLIFAMLLGRLEIYPLLLTANPYTWIKK